MFGQTEVYNALNVTDITSLLDKRNSTDTKPALIGDLIIPSTWTAKKTINYYLISPVNLCDSIPVYLYAVNCRATTLNQSQVIADKVASTLNRKHIEGGFITAVINKPISPQDSTDTYNVQVELTIKII